MICYYFCNGGEESQNFVNLLCSIFFLFTVKIKKQQKIIQKHLWVPPASFPLCAAAALSSIVSSSSDCSGFQHGNGFRSLALSLSRRSGPPPWRENAERNSSSCPGCLQNGLLFRAVDLKMFRLDLWCDKTVCASFFTNQNGSVLVAGYHASGAAGRALANGGDAVGTGSKPQN